MDPRAKRLFEGAQRPQWPLGPGAKRLFADLFLRRVDELIEPPSTQLAPNQLTSKLQQKTEESHTKTLKQQTQGGGREAPAPFALWFQCFCIVFSVFCCISAVS